MTIDCKLIDDAADLCAKLAAVDHAHIVGDEDTVDMLLSGVDPIEARLIANNLRMLSRLARALPEPNRGGPIGVVGGPQTPSPDATSGAAPFGADGDRASSAIYPQVTHIGDNWSRKAPCG